MRNIKTKCICIIQRTELWYGHHTDVLRGITTTIKQCGQGITCLCYDVHFCISRPLSLFNQYPLCVHRYYSHPFWTAKSKYPRKPLKSGQTQPPFNWPSAIFDAPATWWEHQCSDSDYPLWQWEACHTIPIGEALSWTSYPLRFLTQWSSRTCHLVGRVWTWMIDRQ